MPQQLDPRVITVGIEVDGVLRTYDDLNIVATGVKYANANKNECEVQISNLTKETSDYILTETSPFNINRSPKSLILKAGRVSYGTAVIFVGNIISSSVSQPPDTTITLKCLTKNFQSGNIVSRSQPGTAQLKQISGQVANDLGLTLNFMATAKQISNYTFSGAAINQVDKLNSAGNVNAFIDDDELVVKDINVPIPGNLRILDADTGMIGIPEFTELGVKVKFLIDNQTILGGGLRLRSTVYPAVNGDYVIYKLGFELASRDTPFYYIAEAKRL